MQFPTNIFPSPPCVAPTKPCLHCDCFAPFHQHSSFPTLNAPTKLCPSLPLLPVIPHRHFSFSTLIAPTKLCPSLPLLPAFPHQHFSFSTLIAPSKLCPSLPLFCAVPHKLLSFSHLDRSLQAFPFPATVARSSPQTTSAVRAPSNGSQTNLPKHSLGIQVRQQAGLHGLRKDGLHFLGRVEERWVALPWKG